MSEELKICPLKDGERLGVLNHDSVRVATIEDIRKLLPEGYALVPIEPTDAMIDAGLDCAFDNSIPEDRFCQSAWKAMIKAHQESK